MPLSRRPVKRKRLVVRRKANRSRRMPRIRSIVSNTQVVKLKYCSGQFGTTTTNLLGVHQFHTNGIFDPDITSGGHQPLGHDQWASLYSRYRVLGFSVRLTGVSLTAATMTHFGIYVSNSGTIPTSLCTIVEQPFVKFKRLTNQNSQNISLYMPSYRALGVTKSQYMNESNFGSTFGDDPVASGRINIFWQNVDENTSTGHNMTVEIMYYVMLSSPKTLSAS